MASRVDDPSTPTTINTPSAPTHAHTDNLLRAATAPNETFDHPHKLKLHYKSEFHQHNLKRRVANLPMLSRAAYEAKMAARADADRAAPRAATTTAERRARRDERRDAKVRKQANNAASKAAHAKLTADMSEAEYVRAKLAAAADFDEGSDLFSRHRSESLAANLEHMAKTHSFFLPYLDYVKDVGGLLRYLQEKVYIGNVALASGKHFHSLEAVQAHMRDKNGCRIELEGNEDELGEFYDMEALATGSPLFECVELSESESESEADDDAMDDDGAAAEFDALFERALRLGVLDDAEMDRLTDAVAEGATTEPALVARWRPAVRRAERRAARREGDAAARRSTRVVHTAAVPDAADAASLALGGGGGARTRQVGHRSLARFYRQRFRPSAGALGALNASAPEVASLIEAYAKSGVLSSHLHAGLGAAKQGAKSELDKGDMQRRARDHLRMGMRNNTNAPGQQHRKNQSLNY